MTRIYLIRHAQAEGDLYCRAHGWFDSRVTELGKAQITALTHRFSSLPVDAVFSSDLNRALTTAHAVADSKGLEVQIDRELREIGLGAFEDTTFGALDFHHPSAQKLFASCSPQWAPEGGESFQQTALRMTAAFFRAVRLYPDHTVALFSHSTAIRCLQATLRGMRPWDTPQPGYCGNTGISCYEIQGSKFRILFENDLSHLSASLTADGQRMGQEQPPLVWFQPVSLDEEEKAKFYYNARKEAWEALHGSLRGFDGPGFLSEAREQLQWDPRAVQQVMLRGRAIGLIQLATLQGVREGAGHVPFLYLRPDYRCRGIGAQLIGQAVCTYRPMGRKCLRLLCDPENGLAQRFYHRHGFVKAGQAPGALGPLDLLEKPL